MEEKLEDYKRKRNFSKTAEPSGGEEETPELRFVVQYHIARSEHYDFRLEWGGNSLKLGCAEGAVL